MTPKSNSHISHSFVASVYKAAFFQCLFSSSIYSNVTTSTRINILQCTYVHLRLFYLRVILQGFVDPIMQHHPHTTYTCTITLQYIQRILHPNPILHAEDKELFEYYIPEGKETFIPEKKFYAWKARRSSRNASVCLTRSSNDIPGIPATRPSKGTPVIPVTPETFQSFMTFLPFQAILQILQCSSISRESTPFQHSPIRMHILQFDWFPQKTPPSTS